jgi:CheY-like chemotaxis protein
VPHIDPRNAPQSIQVIQQQLQLDPNAGEINSLLGNLRITNDGIETRSLDIVSEMINETGDDRSNVLPNDKVVLVVEDDLRFGKIIIDKAHEFGIKAIVATNYLEVFDFINRFSPIAITLDVKLPETSGWKVIDLLRNDLTYRHIPIHVISGEENRMLALKRGARSFLLKPLDNDLLNELLDDILTYSAKEMKSILVVEDNELDSSQIAKIHREDSLSVTIAATGKEALDLVKSQDFDCIILDYTLPDISGNDLIHEVSKAKKKLTPVIVYSAKDFNKIELSNINLNSSSLVVKGVNSIEHLLEETVSHLHINHKNLAPEKRRIIENIRNKEDILTGKHILVVDDDVRNLFALTTVFERFNINVVTAESGKEAINILNENPKIEMVLMDIMMPEMDGYETTQKIRREHKNSTLPIIAVTAKAMKGDRLKCIEAGASDYITKPVKIDQLLSLMRLWFCK